MPRLDMTKEEYDEQQFAYKYNVMDPEDLCKLVDKIFCKDLVDDESESRVKDLRDNLFILVKKKMETCLTKRQKDVIGLFLLHKKQEHMGQVLHVTQEAINSRLKIALKRLRKVCEKDKEIIEIINNMRNVK